jgi:hypothetical protein
MMPPVFGRIESSSLNAATEDESGRKKLESSCRMRQKNAGHGVFRFPISDFVLFIPGFPPKSDASGM